MGGGGDGDGGNDGRIDSQSLNNKQIRDRIVQQSLGKTIFPSMVVFAKNNFQFDLSYKGLSLDESPDPDTLKPFFVNEFKDNNNVQIKRVVRRGSKTSYGYFFEIQPKQDTYFSFPSFANKKYASFELNSKDVVTQVPYQEMTDEEDFTLTFPKEIKDNQSNDIFKFKDGPNTVFYYVDDTTNEQLFGSAWLKDGVTQITVSDGCGKPKNKDAWSNIENTNNYKYMGNTKTLTLTGITDPKNCKVTIVNTQSKQSQQNVVTLINKGKYQYN